MLDFTPYQFLLAEAIIGAVLALVVWLAKYAIDKNVKQIENHEERLKVIEIHYVTHNKLDRELDSLREEIREGNRITHTRLENLQVAILSVLKNKRIP